MAEIMWHRRETRRQTENTNVMPVALEGLILLDKNGSVANSVFEGIEGFNLHIFQTGIANFTGFF
jgi:hypothetical protein